MHLIVEFENDGVMYSVCEVLAEYRPRMKLQNLFQSLNYRKCLETFDKSLLSIIMKSCLIIFVSCDLFEFWLNYNNHVIHENQNGWKLKRSYKNYKLPL